MTDRRRYREYNTTRRDSTPLDQFQRTSYSYINNFAAQERHAVMLMSMHTAFQRIQLTAEGLQLVHIADDLYEIRPAMKQLPAECP